MIPLAVPNLTGREREYLNNCIDTTYVSSVGAYVTKLEEMVADTTGSKYAVATSSGTTGLQAILTAAGVKADELVILPTFTFIASANAVSHCGAMPWLMDIGDDWCLEPSMVYAALRNECKVRGGRVIHQASGKRVAAIMPVYTLGNIPNMEEFRKIADEYDLYLIADAACAIGATYKGRSFGGLADASVISFNGNKTITCGGGGMIVGNNKELMDHVRHLTTTARIGTEYDFDEVGFNFRMTNIQAAVGCAQMERLGEFVNVKRHIRKYYEKALKGISLSTFPTTEGSSCWFSGIVLSEDKVFSDIKQICTRMREYQIEARTFWKPIHLQMPYQGVLKNSVAVAEKLWERVVTLPCSTNIEEEQLAYVADQIKNIVG